ncbi:GTPase [Escherichia coli]
MVPVVALVGRPNVGKSTLFNRSAAPEMRWLRISRVTRDRKYGRAEIEGREFICIDTGGIDGTEDGVETRMAEQSLLADRRSGRRTVYGGCARGPDAGR